jgi:hypothetical protein
MKKYNWKIKLGAVLIIFSAPIFLSLLLIPFLNIENKVKISLSTIIFIIGEIVFWSGGLLVGKELFNKYKSYFNPKNWFKKNERKTSILK